MPSNTMPTASHNIQCWTLTQRPLMILSGVTPCGRDVLCNAFGNIQRNFDGAHRNSPAISLKNRLDCYCGQLGSPWSTKCCLYLVFGSSVPKIFGLKTQSHNSLWTLLNSKRLQIPPIKLHNSHISLYTLECCIRLSWALIMRGQKGIGLVMGRRTYWRLMRNMREEYIGSDRIWSLKMQNIWCIYFK